jgi:hypothetical protein
MIKYNLDITVYFFYNSLKSKSKFIRKVRVTESSEKYIKGIEDNKFKCFLRDDIIWVRGKRKLLQEESNYSYTTNEDYLVY